MPFGVATYARVNVRTKEVVKLVTFNYTLADHPASMGREKLGRPTDDERIFIMLGNEPALPEGIE